MNSFVKIMLPALLAGLSFSAEAAVQCSMPSGVTLNFGVYDDSSLTATDVSTTFTISCCRTGTGTQTATISISIGNSLNSGQINTRQMKNSANADLMSYQLYYNSFGAVVWGDGVGGGSVFNQNITTSRTCNNPQTISVSSAIFGRIFPQQAVSVGNYSDSLTITVAP